MLCRKLWTIFQKKALGLMLFKRPNHYYFETQSNLIKLYNNLIGKIGPAFVNHAARISKEIKIPQKI